MQTEFRLDPREFTFFTLTFKGTYITSTMPDILLLIEDFRSLEAAEAVQYAGLISLLANKARAAVRELDSQVNERIDR